MRPKAHGTTATPARRSLRWGCDWETADHICCYNRHYAEPSGYYHSEQRRAFVEEMRHADESPIVFHDSVSGLPLFVAPMGRSSSDFLRESHAHGWPSFRSEEVCWESVRCLADGEVVSVGGTHLGHNIPDDSGRNRFCINLCSVAGIPRSPQWSQDTFRDSLRRH